MDWITRLSLQEMREMIYNATSEIFLERITNSLDKKLALKPHNKFYAEPLDKDLIFSCIEEIRVFEDNIGDTYFDVFFNFDGIKFKENISYYAICRGLL